MIKNPGKKDVGKISFANKLGHLVNGVGQQIPTGTNTICFILFQKMPTGCTTMYGKTVCEYVNLSTFAN